MDVCTCGHAKEQHGGDPAYPGSTACNGQFEGEPCDCIAYEESGDEEELTVA